MPLRERCCRAKSLQGQVLRLGSSFFSFILVDIVLLLCLPLSGRQARLCVKTALNLLLCLQFLRGGNLDCLSQEVLSWGLSCVWPDVSGGFSPRRPWLRPEHLLQNGELTGLEDWCQLETGDWIGWRPWQPTWTARLGCLGISVV